MAAQDGTLAFPGAQNPQNQPPDWLTRAQYGQAVPRVHNMPESTGTVAPENLLGISSYTPESPTGYGADEDRLRGGTALTGAQGQLGGLADQYAAIASGRGPMMSDIAAQNAQQQLVAAGQSTASSGVGARRGLAMRDSMNQIVSGQQAIGREHMAAKIAERNAAMAGQGQTLGTLQGGAVQQLQVGAQSQQALLDAQMKAQDQRMAAEQAKASGIGNVFSGFMKGIGII